AVDGGNEELRQIRMHPILPFERARLRPHAATRRRHARLGFSKAARQVFWLSDQSDRRAFPERCPHQWLSFDVRRPSPITAAGPPPKSTVVPLPSPRPISRPAP